MRFKPSRRKRQPAVWKNATMNEKSAVDQGTEFFIKPVDTMASLTTRGLRNSAKKTTLESSFFSLVMPPQITSIYPHIVMHFLFTP